MLLIQDEFKYTRILGTDSWNFETLKCNISNESNDILLNNAYDPDLNFFSKNIKNLDTVYVLPEDFHDSLEKPITSYFSILHLNIRSIKKNFESFKTFLSSLDFTFSILCFSETWCDDLDNFTYDLPNYTSNHQKRSDCKGGGVSAYIHNSLNVKTRPDLSTNCGDIESLTLEIISEKTRNTIVSVLYRPPNGHFEHFENFLTNFFLNTKDSNKNVYIAGDFNLNLLDHSLNKKVHNSLNLIYQNSFILIVNKPSRVTRKTSTTIDHILTNSSVNTNFKTFIFKIDISDHFPICFLQPTSRPREKNGAT